MSRPNSPIDWKGSSLGVDVGGTFTDLVLRSPRGDVAAFKELTTTDRPVDAILRGIDSLLRQAGAETADVARVVHATTLLTNAIVERRGAVTGLIATAGFRDVLEIGRERKYDIYDLNFRKTPPLVPRALRAEVDERISAAGDVLTPPRREAVLAAAAELFDGGARAIAIVFLHATKNASHERLAQSWIAEAFPNVHVCISSDMSAAAGEYERSSTTAANAYVAPLLSGYLDDLAEAIGSRLPAADFSVMLSSGGFAAPSEAMRRPINMLESGPAAGILGATQATIAKNAAVAMDIGGTTAKFALLVEGKPAISYEFEAARNESLAEGSGLPVELTTVDLIEIGVGGGSIAYRDELGLVCVGPQSAASWPGPACFGRGGTHPTVTDANLLLGYLDPNAFAGGALKLDRDVAEAALATLGEADVISAALSIRAIAAETLANAARIHVAERGVGQFPDTLIATGGAGPLHACDVATLLGCRTVVFPRQAGVASALGLIDAPVRADRAADFHRRHETMDWAECEAAFSGMEQSALAAVGRSGRSADPVVKRRADLRCVGQMFSMTVDVPDDVLATDSATLMRETFLAAYRRSFFRSPPREQLEWVTLRVEATAAMPAPGRMAAVVDQRFDARRVYIGGWVNVPVHIDPAPSAGHAMPGPALIQTPQSTLVIPAGASWSADKAGTVTVELPDGS